jgi:tetratricopeptide (TPR) repeat protein
VLKAIASNDPSAARLIGQSYYLSGQPAEAIPWREKLRGSRAPHEVAYMLGNAYPQSSQVSKAVGAFAQMMVRLEQEADKVIARALEIDPKLPGAHLLLGELLLFRTSFDEGMKEIRKEIALNPSNATPYYKLGDAYTRQELSDDAIVFAEIRVAEFDSQRTLHTSWKGLS